MISDHQVVGKQMAIVLVQLEEELLVESSLLRRCGEGIIASRLSRLGLYKLRLHRKQNPFFVRASYYLDSHSHSPYSEACWVLGPLLPDSYQSWREFVVLEQYCP